MLVTVIAEVLSVAPLPKFQKRLVTNPVDVSVNATASGATPLVGVAVKLATGGNAPEVFRYDAQHAFANETSAAYDAASAKASWDRTMAFLGKHL